MFITFEGIDGSGKTTQIRLVEEYFSAKGFDVVCLREPGGTELSEKIREMLLSEKNHISSIAELMLFEAARADLTEKVIRPALEKGKVVLCDRFYDSTTAYQGFGRQMDLSSVRAFNMFATANLEPDLTFYLKLSLDESRKRAKDSPRDRMENSGDAFFHRVINGFSEIAKAEPERFKIVDASGSVEDTFGLIKSDIEKYLSK